MIAATGGNNLENVQKLQFDFNWFDFETRIRKVISELLQPTIKRSKEDKETISEVKTVVTDCKQEVEEMKYTIDKIKKKNKQFDQIFKKISELVKK
jgi:hypothetical protein